MRIGDWSSDVCSSDLPGGSINFVLGGEWRRESSRSTPPPEDTLGQTFGNVIFPTRGNFNVKEAFGELSVPIFSNRPFLEELTLNGAARISDYSTVGTTFTWNVGAIWAPISDVRLRGTYSQSVRAPNIAELFARSEEHTSELQSLMRISYAALCLKKKKHTQQST